MEPYFQSMKMPSIFLPPKPTQRKAIIKHGQAHVHPHALGSFHTNAIPLSSRFEPQDFMQNGVIEKREKLGVRYREQPTQRLFQLTSPINRLPSLSGLLFLGGIA